VETVLRKGAGRSVTEKAVESNVRTLVVDDAAFMRKALVNVLSSQDGIEVVGVARHGREALDAIKELKPDVVTLDVDMPIMDGITAIKHIMIRNPVPVVMVSGLAHEGRIAYEALRLGAVDFFPKPSGTISENMEDEGVRLAKTIRSAASVNLSAMVRARKRVERQGVQGVTLCTSGPVRSALLVLATHGACAKLFRLMHGVPPVKHGAIWAVVDLPEGVVRSCSEQVEESLGWQVSTGFVPGPAAGTCCFCPVDTGLIEESSCHASYESGAEERIADGPTIQEITGVLAERFQDSLLIVVLGGDETLSDAPLLNAAENGADILVLAPERSVKGGLARKLISKRAATVAIREQELWDRIQRFFRQSALKARAADSSGK